MSDEFVDVMLGKVIEALKPNPFDQLGEAALNATLAIISSAHCQSELEALIAVEIVATGFAGLRFLRQSQHSMTEDYIRTYGPYANKLLRLHLDLIQTLDRHRRGHKQTVEVQHVHIEGKVLERLATSDKTTIVFAKQPDVKMRVTSGSWDSEKVFLKDQVLRSGMPLADAWLHVVRKTKRYDD